MKKLLLATMSLLVLAYLGLYLYTRPMLLAPSGAQFAAPPPGSAARGAHLAAITGCTSCHRDDLGGDRFLAEDYVFRLVAPDITRARDKYDDAAFMRLFRAGAKRDGSIALGMPTVMQQRMTDREAADIIAFVRSVPSSAKPVAERTQIFPMGLIGLAAGKYQPYGGDPPESDDVLHDRAEKKPGRHLALIACSECHAGDFQGTAEMGAPPLLIIRTYSEKQFAALMRTGMTRAGTESTTGLMSGVARKRFSQFTDAEISNLYKFFSGPVSAVVAPNPDWKNGSSEIGAADEMMTPEGLAEWKRKNAESMRALEKRVPELQH